MKLQIIIGSTRPNRFSEKPAQWIFEVAKKREEFDVELIDLRDYPLNFFDEPMSPSRLNENYSTPIAKKWVKKVSLADAYIIVSPEYNLGYPAVLKNALDYPYHEWGKKPVGFISYGSVGGARAIEQLRLVAVELQMTPIRSSIPIPMQVTMAAKKGEDPHPFEPLTDRANSFLDELTWWAATLKKARG